MLLGAPTISWTAFVDSILLDLTHLNRRLYKIPILFSTILCYMKILYSTDEEATSKEMRFLPRPLGALQTSMFLYRTTHRWYPVLFNATVSICCTMIWHPITYLNTVTLPRWEHLLGRHCRVIGKSSRHGRFCYFM